MSNPTVRKYPRTLEEAFPDGVENSQWFFPPEEKDMTLWSIVFYTVSAFGMVVLYFVW
jgi:hypothetical protein